MTALDTNVLVDVLRVTAMARPSLEAMARAAEGGPLVAAPAVYAELCADRRGSHDAVMAFLDEVRVHIDWELGRQVWRDAADAFRAYAGRRRRSGGSEPRRLLTDFVIGAHALRAGRLLTRDAAFYRRAFPGLRVVDPTS
ncbi:MAG: type II toxin-antitoxin system VapC family toxin [Vulcanimicrobiaceae bacterium]